MKHRKITNVPHSVHERLLNLARRDGRPFNEIEHYYAIERFLFRLGRSRHAARFVLKGALMLRAWGGRVARATRDIDLLGKKHGSVDSVISIIRECLRIEAPEDGVHFDPESIEGEEIRLSTTYRGVRVHLRGRLGTSRLRLQIDVGFGDRIVPAASWIEYPELLDFGKPRLLGYPPETTVAEKYHAMVVLEAANTRMKDFHDVASMARGLVFEGETLAAAIRSTFASRATPIPSDPPLALTPTFYDNPVKKTQWAAFLRKSRLEVETLTLAETAQILREFLLPPTAALIATELFRKEWLPGGPWKNARRSELPKRRSTARRR